MKFQWPFVRRATYEAARRENWFLKGALHEANKELAKHRKFVAGIRSGAVDVVGALERVRSGAAQ